MPPQLADQRDLCYPRFVAMQAITTIFVVERMSEGWSVSVGGERLGSFSTYRNALNSVKKRRAKLTSEGQRSTVVVRGREKRHFS